VFSVCTVCITFTLDVQNVQSTLRQHTSFKPIGPLTNGIVDIGVGAQSTLAGHDIFARKNVYEKDYKMPEFYIIIARKWSEYPNFYDICPKN